MKIIGGWCDRVDDAAGAAEFQDRFKMSHWEMMVQYENFNAKSFGYDTFQYLVFVDPVGAVMQVMVLEQGDYIKVYSGCAGEDEYFNTDGIAFFQYYKNGKTEWWRMLEDSPSDVNDYTIDSNCWTYPELYGWLNEFLAERSDEGIQVTGADKVLFVTYL